MKHARLAIAAIGLVALTGCVKMDRISTPIAVENATGAHVYGVSAYRAKHGVTVTGNIRLPHSGQRSGAHIHVEGMNNSGAVTVSADTEWQHRTRLRRSNFFSVHLHMSEPAQIASVSVKFSPSRDSAAALPVGGGR